jgi:uncharacterized protein
VSNLIHEVIQKLLVLQDRDRQIAQLRAELASVAPQRERLQGRVNQTQAESEAVKLRLKQLETDRKRFELEVEANKQKIERYSLQQFQTKKNDEYRALAHEIETCKKAIFGLEDQELELMEQAESAQKTAAASTQAASLAKKQVDAQLAGLAQREQALTKQLADLESGYEQLEASVGDESVLAKYKRLRRQRGERMVVGIEHSVCGGCHMKLPTQIVVSCQGAQELMSCPNCGRILYYTRDMDLAIVD